MRLLEILARPAGLERARRSRSLRGLRLLVHGQVVEHDDVARPHRWDQHLLGIREKRRIVDRPIKHGGSDQSVEA